MLFFGVGEAVNGDTQKCHNGDLDVDPENEVKVQRSRNSNLPFLDQFSTQSKIFDTVSRKIGCDPFFDFEIWQNAKNTQICISRSVSDSL